MFANPTGARCVQYTVEDMAAREEIQAITTQAAGRLLRVRALESAAVGIAWAALAAAWVELAWTITGVAPLASAAVCLGPVAMGALLAAWSSVGMRLDMDRSLARMLALLGMVLGLAGVACVALGGYGSVSKAMIALVLVPVGALVGAAGVFWRGVTRRAAAVWLDVRGDLSDRLATAVELAESPEADVPAARCVYDQALAAVRIGRPQRQPMWRRSRTTIGAAALAVAVCVALALAPDLVPPARTVTPETVAAALDKLPPAEVRNLVRTFRQAARRAAEDPALARTLFRAADAASVKNSTGFERALRELEAQGVDLAALIPDDVRRAAGLTEADGAIAQRTNSSAADGGGDVGPPSIGPGAVAAPPGNGIIRVYHPAADAGDPATRPATGPAGTVSYADAWSAARSRAADALARGRVPSEYRGLVRDFFLTEGP